MFFTFWVLFLSKLKYQFFFYYNLLFILHYILLLYFVKILFLILIAFTKCSLFFVINSKHWVRVFCKIYLFIAPNYNYSDVDLVRFCWVQSTVR